MRPPRCGPRRSQHASPAVVHASGSGWPAFSYTLAAEPSERETTHTSPLSLGSRV